MLDRGAAVAMLGLDGNYFSDGPKGVVRLTQVDAETCLVEGTLDGLSPGLHGLAIHENSLGAPHTINWGTTLHAFD